jgi:hypothetical protein
MKQLGLWSGRYPWTPPYDLVAKLRAESASIQHFNGIPLPIGRA